MRGKEMGRHSTSGRTHGDLVPCAHREGAAADLFRQGFGENSCGFFAIGLDQRAKGREESGVSQRIAVEPVLLRLVEGVLDIAIGDAACISRLVGEHGIELQIVWTDGHEGTDSAAGHKGPARTRESGLRRGDRLPQIHTHQGRLALPRCLRKVNLTARVLRKTQFRPDVTYPP